MDLEQLQNEADKDLKINDTELDLESIRIPALHNKYLKEYTRYKLLLTRAENDLNTLRREKWEYYTGKSSPEVYQAKPFDLKILKTDVERYIEADIEIQNAISKVSYLTTTVDFLERTLRGITNRTFMIKNAIEWRRFTSGAV